MEKIKAAIIDDEQNGIEMLEYLLKKFCPHVMVECTFTNPVEAITKLKTNLVDVVFLDIDMPELNGFQFLEKMMPLTFEVIFTTAYNEYAIQAFKSNATDYLLKPIDSAELIQAVNKIIDKTRNKNDNAHFEHLLSMIQAAQSLNKIGIATDEGIQFIQTEELLYFKAEGAYTEVHLLGDKKLLSTKSLGDYEEQLEARGFFRVHNSYVINLKHIVKFVKDDGGYVVLQDGTSITVSRRRKEDFLKILS